MRLRPQRTVTSLALGLSGEFSLPLSWFCELLVIFYVEPYLKVFVCLRVLKQALQTFIEIEAVQALLGGSDEPAFFTMVSSASLGRFVCYFP